MARRKDLGYYRDMIFPDGNLWMYIPITVFLAVILVIGGYSIISLYAILGFLQEQGKAVIITGNLPIAYVIFNRLCDVFFDLIYATMGFLVVSAVSDAFHIRERNRRERGEL